MTIINNQVSKEAIAFQSNSSLAKGLTEVFQELIDYRDSIQLKKNLLKSTSQEGLNRVKLVNKFFLDITADKIIKIIEKETNITLNNIYFNNSEVLDFHASVLMMVPKKYISLFDSVDIGVGTKLPPKDFKDFFNNIEQLKKDLDLNTGKLKKTNVKKVIANLYFDTIGFICSNEYIPIEVLEPMTAEEITSVILHELGHIVSLYDLSDKVGKQVNEFNDFLHILYINKNSDEVLKNITTVKQNIKKLDTDESTTLLAALNSLEHTFNLIGNKDKFEITLLSDLHSTILKFGIGAIFIIVLAVSSLIFKIIGGSILSSVIFINAYNQYWNEIFILNEINKKAKGGDLRTIKKDFATIERAADEFVARHGFSGYLAKANNKIYSTKMYTKAIQSGFHVGHNLDTIKILTEMYYSFFERFNIVDCAHAPIVERLEQSLLDTIKIFKADNLPKQVRDHYFEQCKYIQNAIADVKFKQKNNTSSEFIRNKLIPFINGSNLIEIFTQGKLNREYNELFKTLEITANNQLYIQSIELSQLLNKIK